MCGAIFGQAPLRYVVESVGWRNTMAILAMIVLALSVLLFVLVPHRSQNQRKVEAHSSIPDGVRSAASNPQTWLCALIGFGLASIMLGFGALWAVPWLSAVHGYSTTEAAGIASMLFVGWAIFSPLDGLVVRSDRQPQPDYDCRLSHLSNNLCGNYFHCPDKYRDINDTDINHRSRRFHDDGMFQFGKKSTTDWIAAARR